MKIRYYWYAYNITRKGILRERGSIRATSKASAYEHIVRTGMSASEYLDVRPCSAAHAHAIVKYNLPLSDYQKYYQ
jgi:hypothetical protein